MLDLHVCSIAGPHSRARGNAIARACPRWLALARAGSRWLALAPTPTHAGPRWPPQTRAKSR
eukprot:11218955-Lingulodinium_polyedra.AAC.1